MTQYEEKIKVKDGLNDYLVHLIESEGITTHAMLKALIAKAEHLIITDF
jgi:hypothetical protein